LLIASNALTDSEAHGDFKIHPRVMRRCGNSFGKRGWFS
jgi:hypothetical protein